MLLHNSPTKTIVPQNSRMLSTAKPVVIKAMWDGMQERHPHTLSCCVVVSGLKKGAADGVDRAFRDAIMEMMECGDAKTPLHLKLLMYHEERERQGRAMDIHLSDVKTVLMPRQHVLKALDPNGTATAEELRAKIVPLARIYHAVVLKDQLPADKGVEEALGIYRNFHMLVYTPDWSENDIPVACSCKTCHGHCICTRTLLYGAVFEPRVRVPPEYIAKGTAGRKRLKLLAELADDEKKTDSKVKY